LGSGLFDQSTKGAWQQITLMIGIIAILEDTVNSSFFMKAKPGQKSTKRKSGFFNHLCVHLRGTFGRSRHKWLIGETRYDVS